MKKLRIGVALTLAAAALSLVSGNAWAQGNAAKFIVSDETAKRTMMKWVVNADTARALVDACVNWTKTTRGNETVVVFVLSPTGQIVASQQMDGVLPIGAETGLMKAKTVLYARSSSRAVAERFTDVDGRLIRMDLGREQGLSYYFVGGGLPIMVENQMVGSIGVGGGGADEQCAWEALNKVIGNQPPLPAPAGRGGAGGGAAGAAGGAGGGGRGGAGGGRGGQ